MGIEEVQHEEKRLPLGAFEERLAPGADFNQITRVSGVKLLEIESESAFGLDVKFANDAGPVAGRLEEVRQRWHVWTHGVSKVREADLTILVRVKARKHAASRRATGRLGDVAPGKTCARTREAVHMRRGGHSVSVTAELQTHVISGDQDQIGTVSSPERTGHKSKEETKEP
jgi:hypothetical protein